MKTLMFFFIFFCIGAFFIISEKNLDLKEEGNLGEFSGLYVVWLDQLFDQFKVYTGYFIKMDWLPKDVSDTG